MRKFEVVKDKMKKVQAHIEGEEVVLPLRSTKTSAGYDFYATEDMIIRPQEKLTIATDVKVKMNKDEFLLMVVRSSKGIKDDLILANTIGVIDSDYYNNDDNDGNIHICLRNLRPSMKLNGYTPINVYVKVPEIIDLTEQNTVFIPKGERVVQGIFVKYSTADNCNSEETRNGGIGSTDKK